MLPYHLPSQIFAIRRSPEWFTGCYCLCRSKNLNHNVRANAVHVRMRFWRIEPFTVNRGVKQGSILSPTLFLTVMDSLLKEMRKERHGLSISQTYIGAAIHADDLRTIAESKEAVKKQASVISTFAKAVKLKLNSSKMEVLRISRKKHDPEVIQLGDIQLPTTSAVKCLGVWWQYNLSALRAVLENINKARKAFFALGGTGVFHGSLNPLSGRSIFESCILHCKFWCVIVVILAHIKYVVVPANNTFQSKCAISWNNYTLYMC